MSHRHALRLSAVTALAGLCFAVLPAAGASTITGTTVRVSVATDGTQGNDISGRFSRPAISGDGTISAFDSIARTLVQNDTNRSADVFVHNATSGITKRVSISSAGKQGNDDSQDPSVNDDGHLVAFDSTASNLIKNDANATSDVFVRDRAAGRTILVSATPKGLPANGYSFLPSISANGWFVAFLSDASNLVPGDTNNQRDVFVRDLTRGRTHLVSVANDGSLANSSSASPSISADGRRVAFASFASNLVQDDTNDAFDIFLRDRHAKTTIRVSVASDGTQGDDSSVYAAISGDGRSVAFASNATNLVPGDTNGVQDVFMRSIPSGQTVRVSVADDESQANGQSVGPGIRGGSAWGPSLNADGTRVAFDSVATNLVAGDTDTCGPFYENTGTCPDVFVRDLSAGTTVRVSVASDGTQENDASTDPSIDSSGTSVVFFSAASNLVEGDTNTCFPFDGVGHCADIFVHTQ